MQAGWVLVATGSDRRQRSVGLTQAGRRIYEEAYPLWQDTESRLRRELGRDDSEALRRLLNTTLERTAAS